ncbi:hypothetical protein ACPB9J_05875 [Streptomyces lavendulocolor]|uniref:hypothetical protein n=1 Tax=Streptomyces lavendulocolor TaxID=67316 RepID=UPI003C2ECB59
MSTPTTAKTTDQVLADLEYAAQGQGRPHLRATQGREHCEAHGVIFSAEVPGNAELLRLVERLEQRAWRVQGGLSTTGSLSSGPWMLLLGARDVPADFQAEARSEKGAFIISALKRCRDRPTAQRISHPA